MRREVLEFFAERSIQRVGFDELVDHLAETRTSAGEPGDRDRIALRLHHVHLPKLADTGVIEYDADTGDLHYQPDGDLEHFLEVTQRIS